MTKNSKGRFEFSIFWSFINKDKSEFDKIYLLSFLGIKSILGT
jgi:hypothetical protein